MYSFRGGKAFWAADSLKLAHVLYTIILSWRGSLPSSQSIWHQQFTQSLPQSFINSTVSSKAMREGRIRTVDSQVEDWTSWVMVITNLQLVVHSDIHLMVKLH